MAGTFNFTPNGDYTSSNSSSVNILSGVDEDGSDVYIPLSDAYDGTTPLTITAATTPGGTVFRALFNGASYTLTDASGAALSPATAGVSFDATGISQRVSLTGGAFRDVLVGGSANDTLNGGAGADDIRGGDGLDTVSFAGSAAGVYAYLYQNGAGTTGYGSYNDNSAADSNGDRYNRVENLVGSAFDDQLYGVRGLTTSLIGGAGDDVLGANSGLGNALAVTFNGGAGTDTVSYENYYNSAGVTVNLATGKGGPDAGDTYVSIENVIGSSYSDTLVGNSANNVLDGYGNNFESGEGGAALTGDSFDGGAGTDTVSYASRGSVTVDLGTPSNNDGYAAGDTYTSIENIRGSYERDDLTGDANNNVLEGGASADYLDGGAGIDTASYAGAYQRSGGDDPRALAPVASDGVGVVVDLSLGSAGQNGGVRGSDAFGDRLVDIENLTGSAYADTLSGDAGANVLDGGAGADTLNGRAGNDTFFVDNKSDVVVEAAGGGTDTVLTSVTYRLAANAEVEALKTTSTGGASNISLFGNSVAQSLYANAGNNTLSGGAGSDKLYGFGGDDTFVFNTKLGADNVDTIATFGTTSGDNDTISLARSVFAQLTETGALDASAFVANTDGAAKTAAQHIVYETDTGKLFYDADGSGQGAAVQFATLTTKPALTAGDFLVV